MTSDKVERVAEFLLDQQDEPWPNGSPADRLHYWRDKAIKAAGDLRAIAACEAEAGEREREIERLRGHFVALDRIVEESIVRNDQPDRVRWEGVWYDGPVATAFLRMMRAVQEVARAALNTTAVSILTRQAHD